jgi:hypothetical protein
LFIKEKYTIDMSFCVDKDGFIKSIWLGEENHQRYHL